MTLQILLLIIDIMSSYYPTFDTSLLFGIFYRTIALIHVFVLPYI